jgi:hypothetical protein
VARPGQGASRRDEAGQAYLHQGNHGIWYRDFSLPVAACYHLDMSPKATISERLEAIAAELRRNETVIWVDDDAEVLRLAEAAELVGKTSETIRRWCQECDSDHRLGRCFAGSLWLVSRRRLLEYYEARFGRPELVVALSKSKNQHRCMYAPHFLHRRTP